jgi:hypothetical protein
MTDTLDVSDYEIDSRLASLLQLSPFVHFCDHPKNFEQHVLAALDARGLGEKYAEELATLVWPDLIPTLRQPWYNDEMWSILKAPLSLRARAALSVLQTQDETR